MTEIFLLLAVQAFFAGSEIALLSADTITLQRKTLLKNRLLSQGARIALHLKENPECILVTTMCIITLCIMLLSSRVTSFALRHNASNLTVILATSIIVALLGGLAPKLFFQKYADALSPIIAFCVQCAYLLLYPCTKTLTLYSDWMESALQKFSSKKTHDTRNLRKELQFLLSDYTLKETDISATEKAILDKVLSFQSVRAKSRLMPLVNVDALSSTSTVNEALDVFETHRHSRMPIYETRIDTIIGVLSVSDLLRAQGDAPITAYMQKPLYAAETELVTSILVRMKAENKEMSIIVDEHGGAAGIVTFEDIMELFVGDIEDEFDDATKPILHLQHNQHLIHARMKIQDLSDQLNIHLPQSDAYETLGGFILTQCGYIPPMGSEIALEYPDMQLKLTVHTATECTIERVLIEIIPHQLSQQKSL